ncbi:MAG: phage terminase large subunit [Patescibacteria group bacterium]|nr:phage terminase large subunit [Patescibacteria group bacterium]
MRARKPKTKTNLVLPSRDDVRSEMCRRSLARFVRFGWDIVEPGTELIWNWHIDVICEHLEAVTSGEISQLLINIGPGYMKSLIVSVFWPAWEWIEHPETRSLFSSYGLDLALRDSIRCRDLVASDWYTRLFIAAGEPEQRWAISDDDELRSVIVAESGDELPQGWSLKSDENSKGFFVNTKKGFRKSLSVGSAATGFRGNKVVVDDPLNARDARSKAALEECIYWWDNVMHSRQNDMRHARRVIIMQRLHEQDLSGHVLEQGGYEHLCLPSEFDPKRRCHTSIGFVDPRTEDGELLFPEFFTREVLDGAKKAMGPESYSGQHLQSPAPAEGLIFKQVWLRFWVPKGALGRIAPETIKLPSGEIFELPMIELPDDFDQHIQSWDLAFKSTADSAFVAGQVWSRKGADAFLRDQRREKLDFVQTLTAIREVSSSWPLAAAKYVEDKANGPAVISSLKHEIPGLIAVQVGAGDSKEARAYAVTPFWASSNVYLPHPALYPWVRDLIEEMTQFPKGTYKDQVDAMTQALKMLLLTGEQEWESF